MTGVRVRVVMIAVSRVMRRVCNFAVTFRRSMFMAARCTVNRRNNCPQNGEPRRQRPKCKMSNRAAHAAFSGKTESAADQSLRHILLTLRPSSRSALGIPAEVVRRRLGDGCGFGDGTHGIHGRHRIYDGMLPMIPIAPLIPIDHLPSHGLLCRTCRLAFDIRSRRPPWSRNSLSNVLSCWSIR